MWRTCSCAAVQFLSPSNAQAFVPVREECGKCSLSRVVFQVVLDERELALRLVTG